LRCRCQHCRIFFLAHPRNAGRKDLGCPFGCREAHRKRESNQRSAAYYGDAKGKSIKRDLNNMRKASKKEASEAEPQTELGADLNAETELAAETEFAGEAKSQEPGLQERELEKPTEQSQARAQSGWTKDILEYVRQVTRLVEGRWVGLREVKQMLHEVLRQHSMARRRYIDHLVAQLHQNPP
jgi:hypothetical protein